MPVMFPPGLLKLAIKPNLSGSAPVTKTIGIVGPAALAASTAGGPTRPETTPLPVISRTAPLSQSRPPEKPGRDVSSVRMREAQTIN